MTDRFGWIDLLVNNAGVAPKERKDLLEATEESFDRLISINLRGPFFLTQAVANFWLAEGARHASRPRPKIITVSSISAYTASINRGDYCVSKAGLSMMTQLFAVRLAGEGIGVYEIRPGVVANGHDRAGEGKVRPHDCRGPDPHRALGNAGRRRPRRRGHRARPFHSRRARFSTSMADSTFGGCSVLPRDMLGLVQTERTEPFVDI